MSQDTGPDVAPFVAVKLKDPSGEVKVRSKLAGMKSPVAPSLPVMNAGLHVVDSELLWVARKSNVPAEPQSAVPTRRWGARLGSAVAGAARPSSSAGIPTVSIKERSVQFMTGPPSGGPPTPRVSACLPPPTRGDRDRRGGRPSVVSTVMEAR
jgi:hypothetical protein